MPFFGCDQLVLFPIKEAAVAIPDLTAQAKQVFQQAKVFKRGFDRTGF
jgi:hypothetical protein